MMAKVLTLALCLYSIHALGQWQKISPSRDVHRALSRATVLNNGVLMAIGSDIVSSSNGGETWSIMHDNAAPVQAVRFQRYYDAMFTSLETGYMVYQNTIHKTSDGGTSWAQQLALGKSNASYAASAYFHALYFVTDELGYAVGDFNKIFKTVNGGARWDTLEWSSRTAPFVSYTDVFFLDEQTGFIAGYEVSSITMNFGFHSFLLKTLDGGVTWTRLEVPTNGDFRNLNVQFIDSEVGVIHATRSQSPGEILKTTDGGSTWHHIEPASLYQIDKVFFSSASTGFAFGNTSHTSAAYYRTIDGGNIWSEIHMPVTIKRKENIITDIGFFNASSGFVVGDGGFIAKTSNAGETWDVVNEESPAFITMAFRNQNELFASSGFGYYRSGDAGHTWHFVDESDSLLMLGLRFQNSERGYFYGHRNFLFSFDANSLDIASLELPVSFALHDLSTHGDSLFVYGYAIHPVRSSVLLKSGDDGKHWQTYQIGSANESVVSFLYSLDEYVAVTSQTVLRSRSYGQTWEVVTSITDDYFTEVIQLSDGTLVATMASDKIMYSQNGGVQWLTAEGTMSCTNCFINGLVASDKKVVFAYGGEFEQRGSYGVIWKSTDSGMTWEEESLPLVVDRQITDMVVSEGYVYATGGNGVMLKRCVEDVTTNVISEAVDDGVDIYPVPADDKLFVSGVSNIEEISVYDLHGREIVIPFEPLRADLYQADVRHLLPSVYIIQVVTSKNRFRHRFVCCKPNR